MKKTNILLFLVVILSVCSCEHKGYDSGFAEYLRRARFARLENTIDSAIQDLSHRIEQAAIPITDTISIDSISQDSVWVTLPNSRRFVNLHQETQYQYCYNEVCQIARNNFGKTVYACTNFTGKENEAIWEFTVQCKNKLTSIVNNMDEYSNKDLAPVPTFPVIRFKYRQTIAGYKVNVKWIPYDPIGGKAWITFTDSTTKFTIATYDYSDPFFEQFLDQYDPMDTLRTLHNKKLTLDYDFPTSKFPTTSTFFFLDVDFDNIKELIMVGNEAAPRGHDIWTAYKIIDGQALKMTESPFDCLSTLSDIDSKSNIIHIRDDSGMHVNYEDWYKSSKTGKFVLKETRKSDFYSYAIHIKR